MTVRIGIDISEEQQHERTLPKLCLALQATSFTSTGKRLHSNVMIYAACQLSADSLQSLFVCLTCKMTSILLTDHLTQLDSHSCSAVMWMDINTQVLPR